eukprot:m51a1_g3156 hypothetical protein (1342) ;mRNA; r:346927-351829
MVVTPPNTTAGSGAAGAPSRTSSSLAVMTQAAALPSETNVEQMVSMGFPRETALEALKSCANNVERAVEWILGASAAPPAGASDAAPNRCNAVVVHQPIPLRPGAPDAPGASPSASSSSGTAGTAAGPGASTEADLNRVIEMSRKEQEEKDLRAALEQSKRDNRSDGAAGGKAGATASNPLLIDDVSQEDRQLSQVIMQSLQDTRGPSGMPAFHAAPRQQGLPVGLKNVGNVCYFNSFLQTYFLVPEIRRAVYEFDADAVERALLPPRPAATAAAAQGDGARANDAPAPAHDAKTAGTVALLLTAAALANSASAQGAAAEPVGNGAAHDKQNAPPARLSTEELTAQLVSCFGPLGAAQPGAPATPGKSEPIPIPTAQHGPSGATAAPAELAKAGAGSAGAAPQPQQQEAGTEMQVLPPAAAEPQQARSAPETVARTNELCAKLAECFTLTNAAPGKEDPVPLPAPQVDTDAQMASPDDRAAHASSPAVSGPSAAETESQKAVERAQTEATINFMKNLQRLFASMQHSNQSFVDPSPVIDSLYVASGGKIRAGYQEDVGEINMIFLSVLEHGLKLAMDAAQASGAANTPAQSQSQSQPQEQQPQQQQQATAMEVDTAAAPRQLIERLIEGEAVEYIEAKEADGSPAISKRPPTKFRQLIVDPLGETPNLYDSIDHYCCSTVDYTTDRGHKTVASKVTWITRPPPILMIQENRVVSNHVTRSLEKVNLPLHFDREVFIDRRELKELQTRREYFTKYKGSAPLPQSLRDVIDFLSSDAAASIGVDKAASGAAVPALQGALQRVGEVLEGLQAEIEEKDLVIASMYDQQALRQSGYVLWGAWIHGGSPQSGHYRAFLRQPGTDEWFEYNDAAVRSVTEAEVIEQATGGSSVSAYLLLYLSQEAARDYSSALRTLEAPEPLRAHVEAANTAFSSQQQQQQQGGAFPAAPSTAPTAVAAPSAPMPSSSGAHDWSLPNDALDACSAAGAAAQKRWSPDTLAGSGSGSNSSQTGAAPWGSSAGPAKRCRLDVAADPAALEVGVTEVYNRFIRECSRADQLSSQCEYFRDTRLDSRFVLAQLSHAAMYDKEIWRAVVLAEAFARKFGKYPERSDSAALRALAIQAGESLVHKAVEVSAERLPAAVAAQHRAMRQVADLLAECMQHVFCRRFAEGTERLERAAGIDLALGDARHARQDAMIKLLARLALVACATAALEDAGSDDKWNEADAVLHDAKCVLGHADAVFEWLEAAMHCIPEHARARPAVQTVAQDLTHFVPRAVVPVKLPEDAALQAQPYALDDEELHEMSERMKALWIRLITVNARVLASCSFLPKEVLVIAKREREERQHV